MKIAPVFAVVGLFALAACEMEAPPYGGPGWGGRPPGPIPIDIRGAERACVAQAQAQGLTVRRVGRTEIVTGSRGRVIGTQTVLRVSRGGMGYPVRCNYSFDSRIARITSIRRA